MTMYRIGYTYVVWVDVVADNETEARDNAALIDFNLQCNELGNLTEDTYEDAMLFTYDELGLEDPS